MKTKLVVSLAGFLFSAALPMLAHHSFAAEFDDTKKVALKGSVVKVEWMNPHIWVYFDAKDESGKMIRWQCEGGPPNTLTRNGWTRDALKEGDLITVDGFRAKDGSNTCNARSVTLPSGQKVFAVRPKPPKPPNRFPRRFDVSMHFLSRIATGVAVVAMYAVLSVPAFSQGTGRGPAAPKPPEGPTPRTADGKPDFSGLWERPYTPDMSAYGRGQAPDPSLPDDPAPLPNPNARHKKLLPFTALGKAEWEAYDPANGDYTGSCMPFGLTRSINSPDPLQIMQNPKYIGFLWEQNSWFHLARINQEHLKNGTPTWFGDTIAKWDGDTLVVDTVNFNGRTRLDTIGHPHSAKMHVIERYTRTDLGHIAYEITIDDPVTYTKPWKNIRTFTLRPDWEIMEYSCEENNKDFFEGHIKATQDPNKPVGSK